MAKELVIYADESIQRGEYYSNFYGGALVRSTDVDAVRSALAAQKATLNLSGEVKWSKVTKNYLPKYIELIDSFFDLIESDVVKMRVMFTQNANVPQGLTRVQVEESYFRLYYQFLKHAFGLQYCDPSHHNCRLRIYLDKLPDTREKAQRFKSYLASLEQSSVFRQANIKVPLDQIAEVDSHDHDVLQCVDIVLGAMQFRLNDKHKPTVKGQRRGNRTIAKSRLYKHINQRIRQTYPRFNIGTSTGVNSDVANRWHHSYRHWLFLPSEFSKDKTRTKRANK